MDHGLRRLTVDRKQLTGTDLESCRLAAVGAAAAGPSPCPLSTVNCSLSRDALSGHALDPRAQRAQPLVDPLVAAVDLADVADLRLPVRAQRRDEHRHSGADVGALHALAVKTARAADHRAMRIAEDHPSAHGDELVDEEQAVLEHLLEDQDHPVRLRGERERDAREVGWERGPWALPDLRDGPTPVAAHAQLLAGGHHHVVAVEPDLAAA